MLKNIFTGIILTLLLVGKIIGQKINQYQPVIEQRAVNILHDKQFHFKDLNKNNILDVYEDWRKPLDLRVANLVSQMTLEEKVGMLLINTLNAGEKVDRRRLSQSPEARRLPEKKVFEKRKPSVGR